MTLLLRPGGDEIAKHYGDYLSPKEVLDLKVGDKLDALCEDGLNYHIEIKEKVRKNIFLIHFVHWARKYDVSCVLDSLYLAPLGKYSTESGITALNNYSFLDKKDDTSGDKKDKKDKKDETSPPSKGKHGKSTDSSLSRTKYPDDFFSKPRFVNTRRERSSLSSEKESFDSKVSMMNVVNNIDDEDANEIDSNSSSEEDEEKDNDANEEKEKAEDKDEEKYEEINLNKDNNKRKVTTKSTKAVKTTENSSDDEIEPRTSDNQETDTSSLGKRRRRASLKLEESKPEVVEIKIDAAKEEQHSKKTKQRKNNSPNVPGVPMPEPVRPNNSNNSNSSEGNEDDDDEEEEGNNEEGNNGEASSELNTTPLTSPAQIQFPNFLFSTVKGKTIDVASSSTTNIANNTTNLNNNTKATSNTLSAQVLNNHLRSFKDAVNIEESLKETKKAINLLTTYPDIANTILEANKRSSGLQALGDKVVIGLNNKQWIDLLTAKKHIDDVIRMFLNPPTAS